VVAPTSSFRRVGVRVAGVVPSRLERFAIRHDDPYRSLLDHKPGRGHFHVRGVISELPTTATVSHPLTDARWRNRIGGSSARSRDSERCRVVERIMEVGTEATWNEIASAGAQPLAMQKQFLFR
jgi:hypothetical protein